MVAYDFEYDGILLSDMGCMLCVIDTSLDQVVTVGTDITFNTTKAFGGKRFYSTHTTYDSPLNNALLNPIFGFNEYLPLINLVTTKQSRLCTKRSKGFKCKTRCCAKA